MSAVTTTPIPLYFSETRPTPRRAAVYGLEPLLAEIRHDVLDPWPVVMGTIIRLQLVMTLARLRGQWNHLFTLLGYAPYAEISHGNRSATCYGPCERRDASKTPGEPYELFSKPIKSPQK